MENENLENNISEKVDLKQIEKELVDGLNRQENSKEENGSEASDPVVKKSVWHDKDFINDDAMSFLLGLKNGLVVSILAKGLGKTEKEMLLDLYEVTEQELKLYKKILQEFIRENLAEYVDKIAKITNGELLAITILEVARFREARILIKASKDAGKKNE